MALPPEWEAWVSKSSDFDYGVDELFDEVTRGKSKLFKAAVATSILERYAEKLRMFFELEETDAEPSPQENALREVKSFLGSLPFMAPEVYQERMPELVKTIDKALHIGEEESKET